MLLLPYRIECLLIERPWANWAYMAACAALSLAFFADLLPEEAFYAMILDGWNPVGLVGHMFLHAGLLHLAGNLVFLWVFGNAMCGMIRNVIYVFVFPLCGLLAAAVHNLVHGAPAVGASGAIYGVVGFVLAICPINRVELFYWFVIRAGTFSVRVWVIALLWFAMDVYHAMKGSGGVAYWAHVGGFVSGLGLGLLMLDRGWVKLTEWDNPTLRDFLSTRRPSRPEW